MSEKNFDKVIIELQKEFPHLKMQDKIGEGGQKLVYLAQCDNGAKVALKVIKSTENNERTLREVTAASYFTPPRFPNIIEYGQATINDERVIYIVEEFIEGESLRIKLNQGTLNEIEALLIGLELLHGMQEIAEKRLVHRDIKPENIILGNEGRVIILDFGIARHLLLSSLTQDAAIFGPLTPGYAAPEQILNEKRSISPRTDIFAWGIVMYEMISGFNPFTHNCRTTSEVLARTLNHNPEILSVCGTQTAKLIDWCLKKQPHRRPHNPGILISKLQEVLS